MSIAHITTGSIRKFTIHGKSLVGKSSLYSSIAGMFRRFNTQEYVYRFYLSDKHIYGTTDRETVPNTLKIGESGELHPNTKRHLDGERVYRQLSHIPRSSKLSGCLNNPRHCGNSGSDIRDVCVDFEKRYGLTVTLDKIYVDVWSMEGLYDHINPNDRMRRHYQYQLSEAYQNRNGHFPVGNKVNKKEPLVDVSSATTLLIGLNQSPTDVHRNKRRTKIKNNFNELIHEN